VLPFGLRLIIIVIAFYCPLVLFYDSSNDFESEVRILLVPVWPILLVFGAIRWLVTGQYFSMSASSFLVGQMVLLGILLCLAAACRRPLAVLLTAAILAVYTIGLVVFLRLVAGLPYG